MNVPRVCAFSKNDAIDFTVDEKKEEDDAHLK